MGTVKAYSAKYPPKNRAPASGLKDNQILIASQGQRLMLDVLSTSRLANVKNEPAMTHLNIGNPLGASALSKKPGYGVRTNEISLILTKEELVRLLLRRLTSEEYNRLVHQFGVFYEISDKYYDESTGSPLASLALPSDLNRFFQLCLRGEESPECVDLYIEQWQREALEGISLAQYLGMTPEEFSQWEQDPNVIHKLLYNRMIALATGFNPTV
jgi:hypothetical protein